MESPSARLDAKAIQHWLLAQVAARLGCEAEDIDPRAPLTSYGVSSIDAVGLSGDLETWLNRRLPETLVYDYPSIEALARHLAGATEPGHGPAHVEARSGNNREPLAIVGLACRFPGADDPEAFWRLLRNGIDAITEVPPDRWNVDALFDPDPDAPGKSYTRHGGFLNRVDGFDASFFGIAPREAASIDPQQRLLLELTWEALEHAAQPADRLAGSRTGVFIGLSTHDYIDCHMRFGQARDVDAYLGTGNAASVAAGRISYVLGLEGPSLVVDTACSSSLMAVHLACGSLRAGECDLALVGGVNIILSPEATIGFSKARMLSPDGRCKTFDAAADGYTRGEGGGMVVIKRLSDAQAKGDRILAILRGSAANQDGRSAGLTAPNGPSQERVIRAALADANVDPRRSTYIETHGTGTLLGDPIEVRALGAVFGESAFRTDRCAIGSVKTNIGHLEAAAGIAGLIKVILALQHREIPPHLHFKTPNPYIPWDELPFDVPVALTPWTAPGPRIAGVSSFGFSGTNVHVVVEEAPPPSAVQPSPERPRHLLRVAAASEEALKAVAGRFGEQLRSQTSDADLGNVCFTANAGRSDFAHRLVIIGRSSDEMARSLSDFADGRRVDGAMTGHVPHAKTPKIAFLFTGQGAQYAGMGRQLYETQPIFRRAMEQCDALLRDHLECSLLSLLYPASGAGQSLDGTLYAQPAMFALQHALTELWASWGVGPVAVLGHSVGEYAAACASGVFDLKDGLKLVARRGMLMEKLAHRGRMAAIFTHEDRVAEALAPYSGRLVIAAINAPEEIVVSGDSEAVADVVGRLMAVGVKASVLPVAHAFHSPLMDPVLEAFEQSASEVHYLPARLPLMSNVTGACIEGVTDPAYWAAQIRSPVRFADGVRELAKMGCDVFVEIGPGSTLLSLARQCLSQDVLCVPSLRRSVEDWQQMLDSLGRLYCHGAPVDWVGFDRPYFRQPVSLPTYPFQRERHWMRAASGQRFGETVRPRNTIARPQSLLGPRLRSPHLTDVVFESQISAEAFPFLRDHRVAGNAVLPAAAYLELLWSAAADAFPDRSMVFEAVQFHRLLPLPEEGDLRLQVLFGSEDSATGGRAVEVHAERENGNDENRWQIHVTGRFGADMSSEADSTPRFSIESFQKRARQADATRLYEWLQTCGLEYGPAFQSVEQVWIDGSEALGRISLQNEVLEAHESYHIHPALLDACFHLFGACLGMPASGAADPDPYVPVAIDRFKVHAGGSQAGWAYARIHDRNGASGDSFSGDVRVFDESGHLRAEVGGLQFRRVPRETGVVAVAQATPRECMYQLEWHDASPPATGTPLSSGGWLILSDSRQIGESLARLVRARGGSPFLVSRGATYERLGDGRFIVNPRHADDYRQLFQDAFGDQRLSCQNVVHLWNTDLSFPDPSAIDDGIEGAGAIGVASTLHLVQTLAERGASPRLCLVTRGAQAVHTTAAGLIQAPLWGFARSLSREHPELQTTIVDLDVEGTAEQYAAALLEEALASGPDNQIALRADGRKVPRLVRTIAGQPSDGAMPIRADASYLITGGLGGLGLVVSEWMVSRGARHLVLVGRSRPSPETESTLEKLRAAGARLFVAQTDVSDRAQVATLFSRIRESVPPLRGVIHAAGVLDDALLVQMSEQRLTSVLRPKIQGAWNLHLQTAQLQLDFLALFSSAAALFGAPGQGNYAAANAFLDALARHRRATGLPAVSINWGPWASAGMAAATDARRLRQWAEQGVALIAPEHGMRLLEAALNIDAPQIVVLPVDWNRWRRQRPAGRQEPLLDLLAGPPALPAPHRRSAVDVVDALRTAAPAERPHVIEGYLRAEVASVLGMPATSVPLDVPLNTLGLDSLMGIQLKDRIAATLNVVLPMLSLIRGPSVTGLAHELLSLLALPESSMDTLLQRFPRNDAQALLEQIDELPEDEIDRLLEAFEKGELVDDLEQREQT